MQKVEELAQWFGLVAESALGEAHESLVPRQVRNTGSAADAEVDMIEVPVGMHGRCKVQESFEELVPPVVALSEPGVQMFGGSPVG